MMLHMTSFLLSQIYKSANQLLSLFCFWEQNLSKPYTKLKAVDLEAVAAAIASKAGVVQVSQKHYVCSVCFSVDTMPV